MLHHSAASYSYTYLTDISQNAKVHRDEHETSNTRAVQCSVLRHARVRESSLSCNSNTHGTLFWPQWIRFFVNGYLLYSLCALGIWIFWSIWTTDQITKDQDHILHRRTEGLIWSLNWSTHSPLGLTVYFTHSFIFGSDRSSRSANLSMYVCSLQVCLEQSIFIILA